MKNHLSLIIVLLLLVTSAHAADSRQFVQLPEMMREHMMHNMRAHLLALQNITRQLSDGEYDAAADTAEQRLGMSSMQSHGASHMAPYMPKGMQAAGTDMHHAASRFAVTARNAEVEGGLAKAFGALSEVMATCVACHSAYRIH
jgi:cytochrome c556